MNNIKVTAILLLCFLFTLASNGQEIQEPALAKEIKKMRNEDQKLRKKWAKLARKGKTENSKFKKLTYQCQSVDSINTERMKEIIAEYGWPTYDLVGKFSSVSAWLIVQHADRDPLFQMYCLPLLKKASENGQSDPVNYAFLYDRVQIAKGEKQLYATQSTTNNGIQEGYFQPIEDEANVQNRRAEKGFDLHVETYAEKYGFDYKIPSEEEAKERAAAFTKSYEDNIEKARKAMAIKDYEKASEYYIEALKSNGSVETIDFVEAARAHSMSKHKRSFRASFYLVKAVIRGYEDCESFDKDPDFAYLKQASERNWNNLMRVVNAQKTNKL